MCPNQIIQIFTILSELYPDPKTELYYKNDFTLLIAIALSAQTTDISVNKATKDLFEIADSPLKILELGLDNLINHIRTIGLYNSKAKNIIKLSEIIIQKFNNKVPNNYDDLILLPGVGRKTANVFLNVFYGHEVIAVDTHVSRLAQRIGFSESNNPLKIEEDLVRLVPKEFLKISHHLLILHGRNICQARKPRCYDCRINYFCKYAALDK